MIFSASSRTAAISFSCRDSGRGAGRSPSRRAVSKAVVKIGESRNFETKNLDVDAIEAYIEMGSSFLKSEGRH